MLRSFAVEIYSVLVTFYIIRDLSKRTSVELAYLGEQSECSLSADSHRQCLNKQQYLKICSFNLTKFGNPVHIAIQSMKASK